MLNRVTNNVAVPVQKQVVQNTINSGGDFQQALNTKTVITQATSKNVGSIELNKDGSFILLGDAIAHNPDFKPATVESLQADFGMTKVEAEEILRPKPVLSDEEQQKIMESSPAYIAAKKYSDSAQVEMVARDNNGQVVAVLWKDGSFMAANGNDVHGSTPAETRQNLLKMPNVHLEIYNANEKSPTRLEIEAEQIAFTKKHPELFQQIPDELLANQENQLHSFVINDVLTAHDKKLVDAATSKTPTGLKQVNGLAAQIAIDRETGMLSGEVDENYISKLLAEQDKNQNADRVPTSVLQKSLAFLQQERADFFKRVKPDFTNMTPNEFGELTKSGRFPELPPIVLPKGLDLTKDSKPQMEASLNTKVDYINMIQKQIEFNKSIGESTTYLDNFLNLMKNFAA